MFAEHDRAFKEWAVVCEALQQGKQMLLVRKGGIHEEEGVFRMDDPEFFLMPTYEHQKPPLLQPAYREALERIQSAGHDQRTVTLSAYAVVDTIAQARDEAQVNALADEYIWNDEYVRTRFDFNPYDPLYLVVLRVYNLPDPYTVPMRPEYEGCKSWVSLAASLSTAGAVPAIPDAEFSDRREKLIARLTA